MGCDVLLGPCVNIVRHPLAGRNFEAYSEDPYLAGRIGTAWVKGLQSQGVAASLKHFACNNQEIERFRGNSVVDERTLREIYLPQFETVVKEAKPWTVMCSYNRINGTYASQHNYLLNDILRGEWGFDGLVVSDWEANHTIFESVQGGLDLEMPGPAKYYGQLLEDAVKNWQIEESTIDEAVRRVLKLIIRTGKLDGRQTAGSVNTIEHQQLARDVAAEAMVLLKNDNAVLPLDLSAIQIDRRDRAERDRLADQRRRQFARRSAARDRSGDGAEGEARRSREDRIRRRLRQLRGTADDARRLQGRVLRQSATGRRTGGDARRENGESAAGGLPRPIRR